MSTSTETVFHYSKSRKQRSWLFINMGVMCWLYIAGLMAYQAYAETPLDAQLQNIMLSVFAVASLILFYIAYWHRSNPATFTATVTRDRLTIDYPGSEQWSVDVAIADIKRFESRQNISSGGKGMMQTGVLLNDGTFYHLSMNYGLHLGKLHKAVQQIKPDVTFPSKVNLRVDGFMQKDYDD